MNGVDGIELPPQLKLRPNLGTLDSRANDFARMEQVRANNSSAYLLPVEDGFVMATDVDPDRAQENIMPSVAQVAKHGSRAALFDNEDYAVWCVLDELRKGNIKEVVVPEGMATKKVFKRLNRKADALRFKVTANAVGVITTGVCIDAATSLVSPPVTETILVGGPATANASYMLYSLTRVKSFLHRKSGLLVIRNSEELAIASELLADKGKEKTLAYLDDADDIPVEGYTPDRLNLAEVVSMIGRADKILPKRVTSATSETVLTAFVRRQIKHMQHGFHAMVKRFKGKRSSVFSRFSFSVLDNSFAN